MDPGGFLSGYAWSSNLGWISFNSSDYSICTDADPTNPNTASSPSTSPGATPAPSSGATNVAPHVNFSTGRVSGYAVATALQGTSGCIELSDTTYFPSPVLDGSGGITMSPTTGIFTGYAWGTQTGWIDFSPTL